MTTFGSITKKIMNIDETKSFLSPYYEKPNDNKCWLLKILLSNLLVPNLTKRNKFQFFFDTINGPFIKGREDDFINEFCQIQKVYHTLNRFVWCYKYKKAKIVVDADLGLNQLSVTDKNVICLLHDNSKYLFHINDLNKLSKTSLTNAYLFFSEPLSIKNPYNNLPFNKSTLYNIYFFIRFRTHLYSELLFKFFDCDFNLTIFKNKNEYLLREYAINNFVYNSPSNILVGEIYDMILNFNAYSRDINSKTIQIDEDFPKDKLIKIMRPYLLLEIISKYSLLQHVREGTSRILRALLKEFVNYNPRFGRKRYKIHIRHTRNMRLKVKGKEIEFDDRHITFNNIKYQNDNFLNDHLTYKETARSINYYVRYFTNNMTIEENDDDDDDDDEDDDGEEENNENITPEHSLIEDGEYENGEDLEDGETVVDEVNDDDDYTCDDIDDDIYDDEQEVDSIS